jgi:nitrogen-specific signal transduction histidine kinase
MGRRCASWRSCGPTARCFPSAPRRNASTASTRSRSCSPTLTEQHRHKVIEEEARRKDRFLAVLGHELRNPLASIRNAAEILNRRSAALGSDERFPVEVIGRQTATLVRLVDDLLDIHRLNEGKIVLRREPVELATVIRNAIEAAQPYLHGKRQTLDLALPDERIFAHADAVRLVQVFLNLLSNAAKFTAEGGRIAITLERVRHASGEEVARIRVADNGVGIARELLDRIFDAYMQVAPPGEGGGTGLGLGLSVARRLVALHGGSIRADSDGPGRGTTFTVELAACAPPATAVAPAVSVEETRAPKLRILVADDSEDSAQSLAMVLRLVGHDTRIAHDGHEALAVADDFRPDVAVLDIDMPSLDGYETARALRQRPWGTQPGALCAHRLGTAGGPAARTRSRLRFTLRQADRPRCARARHRIALAFRYAAGLAPARRLRRALPSCSNRDFAARFPIPRSAATFASSSARGRAFSCSQL